MSIYQLSSLISKNNKKYQRQYDKVVAANHNGANLKLTHISFPRAGHAQTDRPKVLLVDDYITAKLKHRSVLILFLYLSQLMKPENCNLVHLLLGFT